MKHRSTRDVIDDLRAGDRLIQIDDEVDPDLEMAEIQRRVYARGGPGLLFTNVRGTGFPAASNLFGSLEQARYLFRDTLESVRRLIEVKLDPSALPKRPFRYAGVPLTAIRMLPRYTRRGPVRQSQTTVSQLPMIKCWPMDGGAFVTLPQVLSDDPTSAGQLMRVNLGMYRIQLSGNQYDADKEVGLHYQIHRGIGVHHRQALDRSEPLNVSITVGGSPAMTLAAVMPLPEGLTELTFAGALAGRRTRMIKGDHAPVYADADFAIVGSIDPGKTKPEGPFGESHGHIALTHPFPVMNVKHVWHRKDAIWPMTVVGRPPQEDTTFGQLIHEITDPVIPTVLPGVKAVHAVDVAGVHPLLLAIGSERYVPYADKRRPQELLTCANAILGQGQLSLAKYLFIVAREDNRDLDIEDMPAFLRHLLERVDWRTDLHFQTSTTIDTLDYSGGGFNSGSKLVIAAAGDPIRQLPTDIPSHFQLPDGFSKPTVCLPGALAVEAHGFEQDEFGIDRRLETLLSAVAVDHPLNDFPLVVIVDDSEFTARTLNNFLWVVFTRSNPAADVHGVGASQIQKHWGCAGSLVIDARIKPHHAPPLVEDPAVTRRVDELAAPGGPLHDVF